MTNRLAQYWRDQNAIDKPEQLGFKSFVHRAEVARYNPKARTFNAVFHTESVAMDEMVVLTDGLDDSYFRKLGNMYWNHYYDTPVAKLKNLARAGTRVVGTFMMLDATQFQRDLYAMMDPEYDAINGTSIGFRIDEMREPDQKDIATYGMCEAIVTRSRWLETSLTPMPSNPDTLLERPVSGAEGVVTQSVKPELLDRLLTRGVIKRSTAEKLGLDTRPKRRTLVVPASVNTAPATRRVLVVK